MAVGSENPVSRAKAMPKKSATEKKGVPLDEKIRRWEQGQKKKKRARPSWKKLLVRPVLFLALLGIIKTVKKGWGWWEGDPWLGGTVDSDVSPPEYECCTRVDKNWMITAEPLQSESGCPSNVCQITAADHICSGGAFHKASRGYLRALRECKPSEQSDWQANMTDFSSCAGELLDVCSKKGDKWSKCLREHLHTATGKPSMAVQTCRPASLATTAVLCHGRARTRSAVHSTLDPSLFSGLPQGITALIDVDEESLPSYAADILTETDLFFDNQLGMAYAAKCPKEVIFESDGVTPNANYWANLAQWIKCGGVVVVDDLIAQLAEFGDSLESYVQHQNVAQYFKARVGATMKSSGRIAWEDMNGDNVAEVQDWASKEGKKVGFFAIKECLDDDDAEQERLARRNEF